VISIGLIIIELVTPWTWKPRPENRQLFPYCPASPNPGIPVKERFYSGTGYYAEEILR